MATGSCLCGQIRYELSTPVQLMNHCHCSRCRKASGAAFGTFAHAPADGFRFTSGAELVRGHETSPGNQRCFCSVCGSRMPFVNATANHVTIPAGSLDDDPGARPVVHLFVGSKAPWHEIADAVPQLRTMPGVPDDA